LETWGTMSFVWVVTCSQTSLKIEIYDDTSYLRHLDQIFNSIALGFQVLHLVRD
jgi:hypothetical protein